MANRIPLDEALRRVLEAVRPLPAVGVPLEAADGRRLTAAIRADRDQPPFDRATLDGYAVRSDDPPVGREPLAVIETVHAGRMPRRRVNPGCATLVMTGAPVPRGADAVVRREDATLLGDGEFVLLDGRPAPGDGVHARGSDARRGAVVVAAGTRVTPAVTAVLASVGATRPKVARAPRVAILVTGDEIRPASARRLPPAAIRNSNGPTLAALVRREGGLPVELPPAPDDESGLRAAVKEALSTADVLLLSGGVSAGDRDLVPAALRAARVREGFHHVDLKPGKPVWFGSRGRRLVFGLPGNPVSTQVTFELLVAPALRALQGEPEPRPRIHPARLASAVARGGARPAWLPARTRRDARGRLLVETVAWNGSGDFTAYAGADALLRRAARARPAKAGAWVEVLLLGGGA